MEVLLRIWFYGFPRNRLHAAVGNACGVISNILCSQHEQRLREELLEARSLIIRERDDEKSVLTVSTLGALVILNPRSSADCCQVLVCRTSDLPSPQAPLEASARLREDTPLHASVDKTTPKGSHTSKNTVARDNVDDLQVGASAYNVKP